MTPSQRRSSPPINLPFNDFIPISSNDTCLPLHLPSEKQLPLTRKPEGAVAAAPAFSVMHFASDVDCAVRGGLMSIR
nr:unnamed protein product [Digitaria exilis]